MTNFHPALPYFIALILIPLTRGWLRKVIHLSAPLLSWALMRSVQATSATKFYLLGYELTPIRADSLALLFVFIFILFSFWAHLYSLSEDNPIVWMSANAYIGSSIAAVLAGDLITFFISWELMAITSALLIWNRDRPTSKGALFRYLLVHLTGGLFLFSGILMKTLSSSSLAFNLIPTDFAGWLIFIGFALNAAIPPLHAWLADAYPEGTPSGSVYLSAFTTKVAIYAFARAFAGNDLLIWIGVIAAIYGVVYALMENDMRRLLAYHIICQMGYMVCGIGLGSKLGINAGVGHAFGNILFKGLLFMATGALIHMTGKSKLTELGGLSKQVKSVLLFYMVGALAISGMPFLNGYVTKSLLIESLEHAHHPILALLLLLVAAGTFLSITIKLAYFAFWGHPKAPVKIIKPLPWTMTAAMSGVAFFCVFFGLFPQFLYNLLPYPVHENIFESSHVVKTFQLLFGTLLGGLLILNRIHVHDGINLDVDWFYRKGARIFVAYICKPVSLTQQTLQNLLSGLLQMFSGLLSVFFPKQTISSVALPLFAISLAALCVGLLLIF